MLVKQAVLIDNVIMHDIDIENIKETVYKCSKCGLCRSVCPVFAALKNEIYLPRGRFNVLNGVFSGSIKLEQDFLNSLDICLECGLCSNFCPSGINSPEIFTLLKSKYKNSASLFYIKYKLILFMHSIKKYFSKDNLYKVHIKRKKIFSKKQNREKIAYFQGCFNRYINPSDKNASLNLLEKSGFKIIKVLNSCCGLPYLSGGNLNLFKNNAEKILNSIPKDAEYIVCSCDSCYDTLKKALKNDIRLIQLDKLLNLQQQGAGYHKPFKRKEYTGGLEIINKKYSCSLMENYFMLKYPNLAQKLLESVFYEKEHIKFDKTVASCLLSKWGLLYGFKQKDIQSEVYTIAEYEEKYASA